MAIDKTDKSLASLLSDLSSETVELVRKEIALARAELSQKVSTAQTAVTSIAIGGVIAFAGLIVLLIGVANAVEMVLPPELGHWLAPLLVGAIVALVGYGMLKTALSHLQADKLAPHRTMESLRRDKDLIQEKAR